jgi:hypothetical protein
MENLENLLKLYENLHSLNKPLADLLTKILPSLSQSNWWNECVVNKLNKQDRNILFRKKISMLDELDIGILLKILINNWQGLSYIDEDKYNAQKIKQAIKVKEIRNFIAHPTEKEVSETDFIAYFECLQKFAEFIGTDIEYSVKILYKNNEIEDDIKKHKLLELIKTKILNPAINSKILDIDIKESLQNTLARLKKKTTSKEIYDFFYDALEARRGKQIYNALKEANLNAFEDIIDEFFNIYWRSEQSRI